MIKIFLICLIIKFGECVNVSEADNPGVFLNMFKPGSTVSPNITTNNLNEIIQSLKLVIIIHGWGSSPRHPKFIKLRDAILELKTHTVIMLDWKDLASNPLYIPVATINVGEVANYLGKLISKLNQDFNFNLDNVHLIAHSIGSHLAGLTGLKIQEEISIKIGRITALDPSSILYMKFFGIQFIERRLTKSDAKIVDVLHTAAGIESTRDKLGTIDFVANCGISFQPQCNPKTNIDKTTNIYADSCSHWAGVQYLTSSINPGVQYPAIKCNRSCWFTICTANLCNNTDVAQFGFNVPLGKTGTYFFNTSPEPPYSVIIDPNEFNMCDTF